MMARFAARRWVGVVSLLCVGATWCWGDEPWPERLTRFSPLSPEVLFQGAGGAAWDHTIRERGWIRHEGDVWKLWYTGYDGTKTGRRKLGYATSTDGLKWSRVGTQPLDDAQWIEDVCVQHDGARYIMLAEGEADRAHWFVSADGVQWQRQGSVQVVMRNGSPFQDGPYGTPTFWRDDDRWMLLYERRDLGIWLATSTDLIRWTNVRDEPVLKPGPDQFDRHYIAVNQVVRDGDWRIAVYHGSFDVPGQERMWSTGLARSRDLIHWEKYPGNPLRPIAENKSSGLLFRQGDGWRLYTMHKTVSAHESVKSP